MTPLPYLDLFSGIGGFAIACHPWFEPIAFCEVDSFASLVLLKNFPLVKNYGNIRTFDSRPYKGIPLITGGFPCQPYSNAGLRETVLDSRYLWPEMCRIIEESKPTWVVIENVVGFVELELDLVCIKLANLGFEVQSFIIPACAKGARITRKRAWIVAFSNGNRVERSTTKQMAWQPRLPRIENQRGVKNWIRESVLFEPKLLRSLNGVSNGMDRLRTLGEAIVPQVPKEVFSLIYHADQRI